jgi:hypothetical protein
MATTTNYGWTTPDDTALVKDGASAIRTLGTSIDTTTKNLNPSTTLGDIEYRSSTANTNTRLPLGTAGQVLTVNSGATAPEWATSTSGGMTLISTTTLTGATVSLTSIPATYNDLRVVIKNPLPATDNKYFQMRFNSDSTANRHASSIPSSVTNQTFNNTICGLGDRADNAVTQSLIIIDIFDYKNTTTWKLMRYSALTNDDTTTTNYGFETGHGAYNQTGAISSLDFLIESGGNFTSGTVLLYGVK